MNREQYLLLKLMEECAEVTQAASKYSQFGRDSSSPVGDDRRCNRDKLMAELNDLATIIEMVVEEDIIAYSPTDSQVKRDKVEEYYRLSEELGYVQK